MSDLSISVEDCEFSVGCLVDSNLLQNQQTKTWVNNCLPALPKVLLSIYNHAGRIVIITLWWLVGYLLNLFHDKFTQEMDDPHLNCVAWCLLSKTLTKLLMRSKHSWTSWVVGVPHSVCWVLQLSPTESSRIYILQGHRGAKCDIVLTEALSTQISAAEEKDSCYCLELYHKQVGLKAIF